jgi:hypothetical protein
MRMIIFAVIPEAGRDLRPGEVHLEVRSPLQEPVEFGP